MHVAGAVGGEHHQRRRGGADLAEFGDGDGVLVEHLQQERLEFVVGAVDLVDEQHARRFGERAQQRSRQQEPLGVQGAFGGFGLEVPAAGRLQCAQVQQLAREIPVVERLRGVDALVALQPDQWQVSASASAAASDVFPVPGSPSQNSGRPMRNARKAAIATPSSAR